jgi:hypothetical protein
MDLYEQLASRLDFMEGDEWAKADPIEKLLIAVAEVSGALLAVYSPIRGTIHDKAEIIDALAKVYDEKIAPLDIPKVGPFIEAYIDNQGFVIATAIVEGMDSLLDKKWPTPDV